MIGLLMNVKTRKGKGKEERGKGERGGGEWKEERRKTS